MMAKLGIPTRRSLTIHLTLILRGPPTQAVVRLAKPVAVVAVPALLLLSYTVPLPVTLSQVTCPSTSSCLRFFAQALPAAPHQLIMPAPYTVVYVFFARVLGAGSERSGGGVVSWGGAVVVGSSDEVVEVMKVLYSSGTTCSERMLARRDEM